MRRLRRAMLVALVLTLCGGDARTAGAQGTVARVSGVVRDDAGKPVPGATIIATNPDQSPSTFTATTDDKGRFGILGLRRGAWGFAIAAPGFQPAHAAGDVQTGHPNPQMNIRLVRATAPPPAGPTASIRGAEIQAIIDASESAAASGDIDTAVSGYRDLLSRVPALTACYLRLGALLEQKGDAAGALDAYRELARIEPSNARATAAVTRLTRIP